jgi:hypothetical protein
MPIIDAGAVEFAVELAKPMVEQTRAAPGHAVPIPKELSVQLNAVLSNAIFDEVVALRERERSVPVENLRLTVR